MRTLAKQGHDVHVLTRTNNSTSVDAAIAGQRLSAIPVYYDLPAWCQRLKHWPGLLYFYYFGWQIGAYRRAKALHAAQRFDRVHHLTFAGFRQPSFMGALGIPFVFGPVGGGETMPRRLRRGLPWKNRLHEFFRDLGNAMVKFDPMMHFTFRRASVIACTTRETLERIPTRFQSKCIILPAIGTDTQNLDSPPQQQAAGVRFLFVGRLIYWKGLHLALRALPEVRKSLPDARLKVIGEGSDLPWLKKIASECGVASIVDWVPWMPHDAIFREYHSNTAFVYPSLHDSGGLVVLEALVAGLPVVCLNLGGPGAIVNSSCGIALEATQTDEGALVQSLAKAMILLGNDPERRDALAANCIPRARELSWEIAARTIYDAKSPCDSQDAVITR